MNASNLVMKSCDSTTEILHLLTFKTKNIPKINSDDSLWQFLWDAIYYIYKGSKDLYIGRYRKEQNGNV